MRSVLTLIICMLTATGCVQPVDSTAESKDGSADTASKSADVMSDSAFDICPAFAAGQALQRFDEQAWAVHLNVAVVQPNKLKDWQVDFAKEAVFRYTLGSKPSLGYRVELSPPVTADGDTLLIPVKHFVPKPDAIAGAAVTSPCIYLHMSGADHDKVSVTDADTGKVVETLKAQ